MLVRNIVRPVGGIVALCLLMLIGQNAAATSLQSPSYRFDESSIGDGGLNQSTSSNYQVDSATGSLSVGQASSDNIQIETGPKTTADPALSFSIENGDVDFGSFTATGATVATARFSVSNYTSYGYVVQILGTVPTNGSHEITALETTGPPISGTEQFGINLVANTIPESVGANPANGQFGFGEAAPNYGSANEYRFVSGETIALAPKSSGVTTYTISYMVNVNSLTPGGTYTSKQTLVVTGRY